MLTQPTTLRMVEIVQESLKLRIAPAVTDREAIVTLATIDMVLTNVLRRWDEQADMHGEIEDIATVAARGAYADLSDLAAQFGIGTTTMGQARDAFAEYKDASEMLACMVEADITRDGKLSEEVYALMKARVDREVAIAGKFQTAGKT